MTALAALTRLLMRYGSGHWWIGERPTGDSEAIARAVAARIGYPTAAYDPFENGGLVTLDRTAAAHVLAVAGTISLAYEQPSPSRHAVDEADTALRDLAADAVFLGNGSWQPGGSMTWTPMSEATFDCGVIGYDAGSAFIFWVEEED